MDVLAETIGRLRAAGCVFAEDEARLLLGSDQPDLDALVAQRVAGTPLEHVLGWAEFDGHRIGVDAGVFVPRRRSEFLVRRAAARVGSGVRAGSGVRVVDLGAGTGALGLAVARRLGGPIERGGPVTLRAVDVDPAAVACARRNGVDAVEGDLYGPLPDDLRGRIDLIVVSAPYVPTDRIALMPPEARDHEARIALDGGADGLDVVRRVADGAGAWLADGGWLATEVGEHQADEAAATLSAAGLTVTVERDEDDATVILGEHRVMLRDDGDRP